jgi:hypothetical protein
MQDGEKLAAEYECGFTETCVTNNEGVNQAFLQLLGEIERRRVRARRYSVRGVETM